MLAVTILPTPAAPVEFILSCGSYLAGAVRPHSLPLLIATLSAVVLALLLCYLRAARPLPPVTRTAVLGSLLALLLSVLSPALLLLAGLGWSGVVLLLLADEWLMWRTQKRVRRAQLLAQGQYAGSIP